MALTFFVIIFIQFIFPAKAINPALSQDDPAIDRIIHIMRIQNQDISRFNAAYFDMDSSILQLNKNSARIRVFPSFQLWQNVPQRTLQFWSVSTWEAFMLYVEPVIVNEERGVTEIGTDYSRFGHSIRVQSAYMEYNKDYLVASFGRRPTIWGQSIESSIIQSGSFPNYDNLQATIIAGNFTFTLLNGQLSSGHIEDTRILRKIAGHKMTWISKVKNLTLSMGEQIIYTGENRSTELIYLNPLVPYFFTALEKDETDNPDNDNAIIFLFGRYLTRFPISLFFEFIIDDYQVDKNNVPHATGYKLGIDGGLKTPIGEMSYNLELTKIDSWTYIHHGQFTSWQNRSHPIGYKWGPDCRSVEADFDLWVSNKLQVDVKYTYLEKGVKSLSTLWASPGTKESPFPSPPIKYHSFFLTSLSLYVKHGVLELGYSNFPNGDAEIEGRINKRMASFFLKVQLVWDFNYRLD